METKGPLPHSQKPTNCPYLNQMMMMMMMMMTITYQSNHRADALSAITQKNKDRKRQNSLRSKCGQAIFHYGDKCILDLFC